MSVELNHTIIPAKDKWVSAKFLADILNLEAGPEWGHFVPVKTANGVTLDFDTREELRGPPLPYRQFDSEALIGGIRLPVMILHGIADESVPITEARRLYAAGHEPKTMIRSRVRAIWLPGRAGPKAPALEALALGPRRTQGPLSHGEPAPVRRPLSKLRERILSLGLWASAAYPFVSPKRLSVLNCIPARHRTASYPVRSFRNGSACILNALNGDHGYHSKAIDAVP
jgi:hypothetical protein